MRLAPIVLVASLGCGAPQAPPVVVTVPAVPIAAVSALEPLPPKEPERPRAPKGYVEMTALRVEPDAGGGALLLGDEARSVILPIYIGGTEGLSIRLRLDKQHYERPLTHDLFDAAVQELGAELWKVQVDEIRGTTFIGRVFLRKGDRIIDLDARPSDAIALALGSRAPIYVSERVLERAGVRRDTGAPGGSAPPGGP
jgi:bifunctional DNase/RNase